MGAPVSSPPGYSGPSNAPYEAAHQAPAQAPYPDPHQGPYAPPAPAHGPLDSRDVGEWNQRFNHALADPSQEIHNASVRGPETGKWHESYCGFCSPIDLCLVTWCLPCLTFGKTHHRLRWGGNMENYEPLNTSCFLFCGASCFGVHWIPMMMQRSDLREKYNINGNCCGDCCSACCCPLCDLVQADKEAKFREGLGGGQGQPVTQQYQPQGGMAMPSPAYQSSVQK